MKKRILSLVCIGGMLCIFAACSSGESSYLNATETQTQESYSTQNQENEEIDQSPLILTTEYEEYSVNTETIRLIIKNPTEEMLWVSDESFSLEKFKYDYWRNIPFCGDASFTLGSAGVSPKSEITQYIDMERRFVLPLNPGTYRINKGSALESMLSNEFTLK